MSAACIISRGPYRFFELSHCPPVIKVGGRVYVRVTPTELEKRSWPDATFYADRQLIAIATQETE